MAAMSTGAIISLVAAAASAATGVAGAAGAFGGTKTPKMPSAAPMDTTQMSKALLPGAKADASARVGGGFSPDFLSGLLDQQMGAPGAGLGVLADIRKSMGSEAP